MISINPDIDRLFGGGLHQGHVTEIVASSGSGKSQLCIQAATMAALSGKIVNVIDTSCTFDMARGQQMAQRWMDKSTKVSNTPANVLALYTSFTESRTFVSSYVFCFSLAPIGSRSTIFTLSARSPHTPS